MHGLRVSSPPPSTLYRWASTRCSPSTPSVWRRRRCSSTTRGNVTSGAWCFRPGGWCRGARSSCSKALGDVPAHPPRRRGDRLLADLGLKGLQLPAGKRQYYRLQCRYGVFRDVCHASVGLHYRRCGVRIRATQYEYRVLWGWAVAWPKEYANNRKLYISQCGSVFEALCLGYKSR